LENLFDISHRNALAMIKIEEDCQFLIAQREKGLLGSMVGADVALSRKEESERKRLLEQKRLIKKKLSSVVQ